MGTLTHYLFSFSHEGYLVRDNNIFKENAYVFSGKLSITLKNHLLYFLNFSSSLFSFNKIMCRDEKENLDKRGPLLPSRCPCQIQTILTEED